MITKFYYEKNIKMETDERFHSESPLEYNINDNEMNRLYNSCK